jgi:hypothetical protein
MENNNVQNNEWMANSDSGMYSIAAMLMELDQRDLIPLDMRQALAHHAGNLADLLPCFIQATTMMFAKAHTGKFGVDDSEGANANWAVAFMADAMSGMQLLEKIERDRKDYPQLYTAMRKARGSNVSLVKSGDSETKH